MGRPQEPTDAIIKCCIGVGCSLLVVYCKGKDTHIPPNNEIKAKMATGQTSETSGERFHNIETECDDAVQGKLALQLHISQSDNHPLPVRVITERSLMALIK